MPPFRPRAALMLTAFVAASLLAGLRAAPAQSAKDAKRPAPAATPVDRLKVQKGFRVELLYTVPRDSQGSWVSLAVDPKGRLITSDQDGKLFRVTPPPAGTTTDIKVESIPAEIGMAQGLLWAFDSLYVVVNGNGRHENGLYRVRDTDGDDMLDKVEFLQALKGGGEHGPHGIVLAPDGKSLYVVAGNATTLPPLHDSLVPRVWGEDTLLPRMPDGRGFMRDEKAPGGYVCRVDPDGKQWELVSMGYRNPYDLAFQREGDLFTYDSDMEWDINMPWYRPTRVCDVVSGADFGYRGGSGKFPTSAFDTLRPVVNVGPGSPTGVTFGYGAKFPAKYQEALFLCDWSYGKLYAVHLKPQGASYSGELEEFITGTPLPLTDIVVNPKDGALYFAIGGRKTTSGLYRVTYDGPEPTAPAPHAVDAGTRSRASRRELEKFHARKDPKAVETAWPFLSSPDRFLRYAARVAIEHQDPSSWRERALAETHTQAALEALLALVRVSTPDPAHVKDSDPPPDTALRHRILAALDRLKWDTLDDQQRRDLLRVYTVLLNRMGRPDEATASRLLAQFDALYPAKGKELNVDLCNLLVYLGAPDVAEKSLELLAKAPTQEEQIDYARTLRVLKTGWTPALRKAYFSWFRNAAGFRGGASLEGFLKNIKSDAAATLSESEKAELKPLLDAPVQSPTAIVAPRPKVKDWTLDELVPVVESGLKQNRDFDRGRSLFGAASCAACHRFNNEGGATGPDLTGVAGRFSPRDLLESIVNPSKVISDQYGAITVATSDGKVVTGRIVNLHGDIMQINTNMLDPNAQVSIDRKTIEETKPSSVSMMPEGLLNTLHKDEVLDLIAYLLAGGKRESAIKP
ncbi:MAG: c-type cytochrome [Isosphaeraceae bacterium]|nr:c-type cytochrome [Isosphaeraceae bacterium]